MGCGQDLIGNIVTQADGERAWVRGEEKGRSGQNPIAEENDLSSLENAGGRMQMQ